MAEGSDSVGARIKSSLKFWLVVAVLCGIIGAATFYFGRDYVGKHLHEMEVRQRAPEILPQTGASTPASRDSEDEPPLKPVIVMAEREPTAREERRARREVTEPQDGASLHAAEEDAGDDAGDEDAGAAESPAAESPADEAPEEGATQEQSGGGYVVTSGAFADEANARRQVERLAQQGYQPYLTSVERDGVTYRRVNVGLYGSREQAEEVRDRLRSQGFDAAIWTERE